MIWHPGFVGPERLFSRYRNPIDPSPSPGSGESDWEATAFVYGVWGLMALALFGFLWYYSHNVPYIDDLEP